MRKYYTDWKTIIIVFAIGLALWIFGASGKAEGVVLLNGSLMVGIPIALIALLSTKYSYVSISGNTLKFVYVLFYRRTIYINSITEINDQPTYKAAKSAFRSLYIFYKDKNDTIKWIELRITIFPEKTLGRLIKDLKQINPRIELNKYSQKLMESAPE